MKKRNIERIYSVLEKDSRLVDEEGKLLKNKVQELAQKMDSELLRLILNDDYCKSLFIQDVDGIQVFDKDKFCWVVNSKDFLPDGFTKYKNAILLTDENGNSIKKSSDVVLEFPFKDCYLEADSTKDTDEREEVFYNETLMKSEIDTLLAPKAFCNAKKYDSDGEHAVTSITDKDNLIIKGNNLLALHSLVPKYKGQIKLMYWDVLYNTESDKVPYADSFKHTSWLTMMKNRLEVAKTLLKDDGVICVQCDDNEQAYLKILCDEIFGRHNFINCICVNMYTMSGPKVTHAISGLRFPKLKEYILIYGKKKQLIRLNIPKLNKEKMTSDYNTIIPEWTNDNNKIFNETYSLEDANNIIKNYSFCSLTAYCKEHSIKLTEEWKQENAYRIFAVKMNRGLHKIAKNMEFSQNLEIIQSSNGVKHLIKTNFDKTSDGTHLDFVSAQNANSYFLGDCWYDNDMLITASAEGGVSLNLGQKPEKLIERIIKTCSSENDYILDAYLGSGTTAAVSHILKRRYIGIEQLNEHSEMEIERLNNLINGNYNTPISKQYNWQGGGSFIYCELAKNSQNVIDRIITAPDNELPDIYEQLLDSPFLSYKVDIQEMEKQKGSFTELTSDDQRKLLISILDKNTLYINYSDMDDEDYALSDNDKAFTKSFYSE